MTERNRSQDKEFQHNALALLTNFDALVRAMAADVPDTAALAAQVAQNWRALADRTLQLEPAGVLANGQLLLAAKPECGSWVPDAFAAGLRGLTALRDVQPQDMTALAHELAILTPTPHGTDRLHTWLWTDSLGGFRVELAPLAPTDAEQRALQDALLAPPLPPREPPPIALSAEESAPLAATCNDPVFWLAEELSLVLTHAEMQPDMPAHDLARRLRHAAAAAFDRRLLAMLGALAQGKNDYARFARAAFEDEPIGEAIGSRAPLDPAGLQQIGQIIEGLSPHIGGGVLRGLLARATEHGEVLDAPIVALATTLGVERFVGLVELAILAPISRSAFGRVIARLTGGAEWLAEMLPQVTPSEAIGIIHGLPVNLLLRLTKPIHQVLLRAQPRERSQVAQLLLGSGNLGCLAALAAVLRETEAKGWELRTIRAIYQTLLLNNVEPEPLLKLMQSSRVAVEARLVMLDEIARSHIAQEGLRWRMAELLDPPAIQERLAQLRKHGVQP